MFLPVYNLGKKWDLSLSGAAYVSLRGWPFDSERDMEFAFEK
jgi:hypothetical protein